MVVKVGMLSFYLLTHQTLANESRNIPLHALPPEVPAYISVHLINTKVNGELTMMQVM